MRAHRGVAVLDLRSPQVPDGDIEVDVRLERATLTLLVADDAQVDDWDLLRVGRGRVKDATAPASGAGRRVVVTGELRNAEIRVRRGGVAILSAMCSKAYLADLWRAHREGGIPTVHDPAGSALIMGR